MPEELVLVNIPLCTSAAGDIRIHIKERDTREVRAALNGRRVQSVADELRVVQLDDGRADSVYSGQEVDDSALGKVIAALLAAAVAI